MVAGCIRNSRWCNWSDWNNWTAHQTHTHTHWTQSFSDGNWCGWFWIDAATMIATCNLVTENRDRCSWIWAPCHLHDMRDVVDGVRVVGMHIKYATIEPNALTLNNKRRRCVVLSVNTKKKTMLLVNLWLFHAEWWWKLFSSGAEMRYGRVFVRPRSVCNVLSNPNWIECKLEWRRECPSRLARTSMHESSWWSDN